VRRDDFLMGESQLEKIANILSKMSELESAIGQLYAECAKKYPEEMDFWSLLSNEEFKHGEDIMRASRIVSQNFNIFSLVRPYNTTVLNNVIRYVKDIQVKVTQGTLSKKELLTSLRDLEQSLLETKGLDFLKTDLLEYNAIAKGISEDTIRHSAQMSAKITKT
jgi:hypothetical protein